MAYKISKYKGKTTIKDTKSGKSMEIDIDKFMEGGVAKYEVGGCPDGQVWDAMTGNCKPAQGKGIGSTPTFDPIARQTNLNQITEEADLDAIQQDTDDATNFANSLPNLDTSNENTLDDTIKRQYNDAFSSSTGQQNNDNKDFNIHNQYAGVDIPTAAYTLGQSINNKDTLGTVASAAKVGLGLFRNVASGIGQANRTNQVMGEAYKDLKNNKNPDVYAADGGRFPYLAEGGKGRTKEEEFATGEYMKGVTNENTEPFNAEVEDGEYLKTKEGDIAQIVGRKHSDKEGGEKIQMEPEDKVLSDQLKLGGKLSKELSEKYDLKLKAKDTYSTVIDKFNKKSKMNKIIEEETDILKKISDQQKVNDQVTKNFNLEVLTKTQEEIASRKQPIEEEREIMFDELFDMQEASKTGDKKTDNNLAFGGDLDSLAKEYNISTERAQELVQSLALGGKKVPEYGEGGLSIGDTDPKTGKKVTKELAAQKVADGEWEDLGSGNFIDRGTEGSSRISGESLQSYKETWDKNKFPKFEDYVSAAEQWKKDNPDWNKSDRKAISGTPDKRYYTEEQASSSLTQKGLNIPANTPIGEDFPTINGDALKERNTGLSGAFLFPDENVRPPSSLQGTIKPERRFDRVSGTETNIVPYLQDAKNRRDTNDQRYEGFSPNVAAAMRQNDNAVSQQELSKIRAGADERDLNSEERATYANAQIQAKETNASVSDRLAYEQRQYRAQANTDNEVNNYYNQLQAVNKQRFMDINNLNLVNATNEDVFFDGQSYKRKNSDRDILSNITV